MFSCTRNMVFDFYDNFSVLFSILELTKQIFRNTLHDICLYLRFEFSIQSMIVKKKNTEVVFDYQTCRTCLF
jgi:hypothetical protein